MTKQEKLQYKYGSLIATIKLCVEDTQYQYNSIKIKELKENQAVNTECHYKWLDSCYDKCSDAKVIAYNACDEVCKCIKQVFNKVYSSGISSFNTNFFTYSIICKFNESSNPMIIDITRNNIYLWVKE